MVSAIRLFAIVDPLRPGFRLMKQFKPAPAPAARTTTPAMDETGDLDHEPW
jgi:hypothetical protein